MLNIINKLNFILTYQDKRNVIILIVFSILISVIETVGVSLIMPFMAVATDYKLIENNQYYSYVYNFLNFKSETDFVIAFGLSLVLFYIFRGVVNLSYFYNLAKFSKELTHVISCRIFRKYLDMRYIDFTKNNSSALNNVIMHETTGFTEILSSILLIVSEVFIVIFIYVMMLVVDYQITVALTLFLFLNLIVLTKTISSKLKQLGYDYEQAMKRLYSNISKTLGNFKIIKLQANSTLESFENTSYAVTTYGIMAITFSHIPRLLLEMLGFGILAFMVTYLVWKHDSNISHLLPILSLFAVSFYRLMPSVNRIITGYNQIMYFYRSLDLVYDNLVYEDEELGDTNIVFKKTIKIENLSFEYKRNKKILESVNLTITKGDKVAFIGESGSGKSTMVDIVIGLYRPIDGNIYIDNHLLDDGNIKHWRKMIGYIPQSVYLFDGSVGENIAFGNNYNEGKIISCLKKSHIYDFLESQQGIDTVVGEGGIMLSGGQKQRIAIARALYLDPEILVLDEATASLDSTTEQKIMEEIYNISADKTLIIIAHRLSTIKNCNKIYEIKDKKIMRSQ